MRRLLRAAVGELADCQQSQPSEDCENPKVHANARVETEATACFDCLANIYSKESAGPDTSDEMFSFWQSAAVAVYVALLALVSSLLRVRSLFRICPKNHLTPANAGTFADNSSFFRSRMAEIT